MILEAFFGVLTTGIHPSEGEEVRQVLGEKQLHHSPYSRLKRRALSPGQPLNLIKRQKYLTRKQKSPTIVKKSTQFQDIMEE